MNIRKSLPNTVVEVDTVDKSKSRLYTFWMYQDDFTAELTVTGDRSEYDIKGYKYINNMLRCFQ